MPILNIAAYKFIALERLPELQSALLAALRTRAIKGTVLLAEEGINLFLAAGRSEIHDFLAWLRTDARFQDLDVKESWSSAQPFRKLAHREELQGKTVVSFCTGGIRCEKAAILMQEAGVTNVYQLDGGILKYFEQSGHAHFEGE